MISPSESAKVGPELVSPGLGKSLPEGGGGEGERIDKKGGVDVPMAIIFGVNHFSCCAEW